MGKAKKSWDEWTGSDGSGGGSASSTKSYHNGGVEGSSFSTWYSDNLADYYSDNDDSGPREEETGGSKGSGTKASGSGKGSKGSGTGKGSGSKGSGTGKASKGSGTKGSGSRKGSKGSGTGKASKGSGTGKGSGSKGSGSKGSGTGKASKGSGTAGSGTGKGTKGSGTKGSGSGGGSKGSGGGTKASGSGTMGSGSGGGSKGSGGGTKGSGGGTMGSGSGGGSKGSGGGSKGTGGTNGGCDLCELDSKPVSLTLTYSFGTEIDQANDQDDKKTDVDTTGSDDDGMVFIRVLGKKDDEPLFEGMVAEGEDFVASADKKFDSETRVEIFDSEGGDLIQEIRFHTSCSQPLAIGDTFGSITLAGATTEDGEKVGCDEDGDTVITDPDDDGSNGSGSGSGGSNGSGSGGSNGSGSGGSNGSGSGGSNGSGSGGSNGSGSGGSNGSGSGGSGSGGSGSGGSGSGGAGSGGSGSGGSGTGGGSKGTGGGSKGTGGGSKGTGGGSKGDDEPPADDGEKSVLNFTLGGDGRVDLSVTETPEGQLFFSFQPADWTDIDDIDGLFFDVAEGSDVTSLNFFPDPENSGDLGIITDIKEGDDNVDTLANGSMAETGFDVGLTFGNAVDSSEGFNQVVNFTVWSDDGPLSFDDIDLSGMKLVVNSDEGPGELLSVTGSDDPEMMIDDGSDDEDGARAMMALMNVPVDDSKIPEEMPDDIEEGYMVW